MKHIIVFLFVTLTLCGESLEDIATKAHTASVNALLIFTSTEGLNSGRYHFTNVGVDMDVVHLPFTYQLPSQKRFNTFVMGNVGYSRVSLANTVVTTQEGQLNYDNHIRTYTAGLGGGVRYKFDENLYVLGGAELIYSRSGASVRQPDDGLGDIIEDFFNKNYTDNLSYEFLAQIHYSPKDFRWVLPYVDLLYKVYDTKSNFSFNEMLRLRTLSSVVTFSVGAQSSALKRFGHNYIALEGYYHANYLKGSVKDVVKFQAYSTVGGVVYLYTPKKPWWASRFFVELSSVMANGLEGYNVGVGFSVAF
jgi:hypothetical protein